MKKKIIAVSLITAMVVCNSMTVWAADTWNGSYNLGYTEEATPTLEPDSADRIIDGGGQKDVKGVIELGARTASFSVEISWGSLVYGKDTTGTTSTWMSDLGEYSVSGSNKNWTADDATNGSDKIIITNKSNVGINAAVKGDMSSTVKTAYGISDGAIMVNGSNQKIINLSKSTSPSGVVGIGTISVEGTVTKAADLSNPNITLGTVTITLSQEEE